MIKSQEQIDFERDVTIIIEPLVKQINKLEKTVEDLKRELQNVRNRRHYPYAGRL